MLHKGYLPALARMSVFVKCVVATLVFLTVYLFSSLVVFAQLVPDGMLADSASLLSAAAAAFLGLAQTRRCWERHPHDCSFLGRGRGRAWFLRWIFRTADLHARSEPRPVARDLH